MRDNQNQHAILKGCFKAMMIFLFIYSGYVFADDGTNKSLKDIALSVMGSFQALGQLMIAMSYVSGIGFSIAAIFKFKQHKDNPTQIPVSTPIALLGVGVVLIFLPGIVTPVGYTIFGTGANLEQMAGGYGGAGATNLPGGSNVPTQ
jgi:intracellular multiplication protein IcmD